MRVETWRAVARRLLQFHKTLNISTNHSVTTPGSQSDRQAQKKAVMFLNTTAPAEVIQSYVKLIIGSFLQKFNICVRISPLIL